MNSQSNYEQHYNDLAAKLEEMHERNVKRMRSALKSLLIVPTIFLILLFLTHSSKTIFLVLWIVSMFVIACILIVIEYQDYTLRQMLAVPEEETAVAEDNEAVSLNEDDFDAEYAEEEAPAAPVGSSKDRMEELLKALGGMPDSKEETTVSENAD